MSALDHYLHKPLSHRAGPQTPWDSQHPADGRPDTPGDPHVGWDAPKTPPGSLTYDAKLEITQGVLDTLDPTMSKLAAATEAMAELFRQQLDRVAPQFIPLSLATVAKPIHTLNRPYNAIIVGGTAGQTLTVIWPGQATYNKILAAGWNILNIPEGAQLLVNAAVDVLLVVSYQFLGNPL